LYKQSFAFVYYVSLTGYKHGLIMLPDR